MSEEIKVDEQQGTEETVEDRPVEEVVGMTDDELEKVLSGEPEGEPQPEKEAEEPPESDKTEEEPATEEPKAEEPKVEDVPVDIEKLRKQLADKELFIQRQGTEIGELRKQNVEYKQSADALWKGKKEEGSENTDPEAVRDRLYEDPAAVIDSRIAYLKAKETEISNRVRTAVPEIDNPEYVEKLAQAALESGDPEAVVTAFRRNPASFGVEPLLELKRRLEAKEHSSAEEARQKEIADLRAKLELVEGKKKTGNINEKIQRAVGESQTLSGDSGQASTEEGPAAVSESQLANLTDAELEAMLKKG